MSELPAVPTVPTFPPVSVRIGSADPHKWVERFYASVAAIFEAWRDAGVDICKVQELLGHRHITTT